MKKIIIHFLFVASCLSWVLFFILSFILFSPNQTLQVFNSFLPSSYDLQYSEVVNKGSFLNPILEFSNISIQINDVQVYSANKSHYGFLVSPALIIGKVTMSHIHLEEANILLADYSAQKMPKLKINLDKNISISFHETSLVHLGSEMLINGQLDSLIPGLANGHINISHHGKISNLSIDSDGEDSNFLVNLNTLDWLKFFPNDYLSSSKTMQFGITAIGSLTPKGSSIKGSLNLEESSFSSLTIKKNYGSFFFQSQDGLSILSLKNFLHPFVDEQFPIKFNLRNNTIAIPNLFLSNEVLEFQDSRFSNIAVKDIFATFKNGVIKYSGKIIDLDLLNVYFDELLNIQGFFFGTNDKVEFTITPSQSFIKNKARFSISTNEKFNFEIRKNDQQVESFTDIDEYVLENWNYNSNVGLSPEKRIENNNKYNISAWSKIPVRKYKNVNGRIVLKREIIGGNKIQDFLNGENNLLLIHELVNQGGKYYYRKC